MCCRRRGSSTQNPASYRVATLCLFVVVLHNPTNNLSMQSQPAAAALQVAVDGLEPTYSVLRSPLLPHVADQDAGTGPGPVLLPCRLWGNSDRDGDVSEAGLWSVIQSSSLF